MNNNYIPQILKEKILSYLKYFVVFFYFSLGLLTIISLITFDINDNSFLTKTNIASTNFFGDYGSYYASFILYTFGILSYLLAIFFFIFSILTLFDKRPKYIFIRLIFFFISLIIMPQILIYYLGDLNLIDGISTWGIFAENIFKIYESKIIGIIKDEHHVVKYNQRLSNFLFKKLVKEISEITRYYYIRSVFAPFYLQRFILLNNDFVKSFKLIVLYKKYKKIIDLNPEFKKIVFKDYSGEYSISYYINMLILCVTNIIKIEDENLIQSLLDKGIDYFELINSINS